MSVLLETSVGDLVIDMDSSALPVLCKNFLKLCKIKYYDNSLFYQIEKNFLAKAGDPQMMHLVAKGGQSIYELLQNKGNTATIRSLKDDLEEAKKACVPLFSDEAHGLQHRRVGQVGMVPRPAQASATANDTDGSSILPFGSQFYVTLRNGPLSHLDGKQSLFGEIAEGLDTFLKAANSAFVDDNGRPLQNIRIYHAIVLEDPYEDPMGLTGLIPDASPQAIIDEPLKPLSNVQDELLLIETLAKTEAASRAVTLEILGDIPDADAKPPDDVLFVCKLNPATEEGDLEILFSRFGKIHSCQVIRDWKTGNSLQYAFIEFSETKACEDAYFKMQDVLLDDRRIHVDFCQSVSNIWHNFKRFGGKGSKSDALAAESAAHSSARFQNKHPPSRNSLLSSEKHENPSSSRNQGFIFETDTSIGYSSSAKRKERRKSPLLLYSSQKNKTTRDFEERKTYESSYSNGMTKAQNFNGNRRVSPRRREASPSRREQREASRKKFREQREVSPSRRDRHEVSPSRREQREASPSRREQREASPSRREQREASRKKFREQREVSPSRREQREASPSRREQREASRKKFRDGHEASPSRRDRHEASPGRRDRHEVSPGRRDRHEASPGRRDRHEASPSRRDRHEVSPGRRDRHEASPGWRDRHETSRKRERRDRHEVSPSRRE
ncbi:peptidyl-prolyl cis-trans isomerase, cyclophilin-type domain-containing protein [Cardiosporidium cionae]|uniref:Peptidyl-prolyl cis-trans isomerase n=1 Tax=Cardiosporidium cionae TaxID=476202 RepID=A0ABQ7J5U4_9APIC|nr:peptidyl-prolyl cis-trans isomerase, cyclophilin-type domain-containing protein [Cardiosporidium cionae]|eukprot:KAF8819338.1 peptidyl-prolyl cis-trans isomerase, cyclophilin-type domain-containing protein [Cardiosporidium cionae]